MQILDLIGNETITRADFLIGRDAEPNHVDAVPGLAYLIVQSLAEQSAGAMQARRIDKD